MKDSTVYRHPSSIKQSRIASMQMTKHNLYRVVVKPRSRVCSYSGKNHEHSNIKNGSEEVGIRESSDNFRKSWGWESCGAFTISKGGYRVRWLIRRQGRLKYHVCALRGVILHTWLPSRHYRMHWGSEKAWGRSLRVCHREICHWVCWLNVVRNDLVWFGIR